jgi:hypothetical protein
MGQLFAALSCTTKWWCGRGGCPTHCLFFPPLTHVPYNWLVSRPIICFVRKYGQSLPSLNYEHRRGQWLEYPNEGTPPVNTEHFYTRYLPSPSLSEPQPHFTHTCTYPLSHSISTLRFYAFSGPPHHFSSSPVLPTSGRPTHHFRLPAENSSLRQWLWGCYSRMWLFWNESCRPIYNKRVIVYSKYMLSSSWWWVQQAWKYS